MKRRWMFRPDLAECTLEERVVPAVPNLGIIVLTPSGYVLLIPFPGANSSGAGSLGVSSGGGATAAPVSGAAIPSSLYITGNNGLSSMRPGNITGVPSLASAAAGASGGVTVGFTVGSGTDSANGPASNIANPVPVVNAVGLFTVGDSSQRPIVTTIGATSTGSGSPVLPPGQSYRDNAPVPPPTPTGVLIQPPSPINPSLNSQGINPFAPNPQNGAPRFGPFGPNRSLPNPLPSSVLPPGPGMPGN